jgi:hypothetical protein
MEDGRLVFWGLISSKQRKVKEKRLPWRWIRSLLS